ncbi:MAG: hypothetical protein JSV81_18065 [Anaerolineales bacterium]|nr:MAG: hypothetical protein JSV81_18065 [Anaerolineales bacterium]
MITQSQPLCLYCERGSEQVPLLTLRYQEGETWICPQHLPILIHNPAKLAGKLPGAENLTAEKGHGHG